MLGHLLACLFYRIEGICQLRGVAPELSYAERGRGKTPAGAPTAPHSPHRPPPHSLIIGHSMFTQNGGVDKDWVACVAHRSVTTFKESRPILSKRNSIRRFFNKILQYLCYVLKKGKNGNCKTSSKTHRLSGALVQILTNYFLWENDFRCIKTESMICPIKISLCLVF